jgi:hypothetical protein
MVILLSDSFVSIEMFQEAVDRAAMASVGKCDGMKRRYHVGDSVGLARRSCLSLSSSIYNLQRCMQAGQLAAFSISL